MSAGFTFVNGQWHLNGQPIQVPKFGYGGDVEGGSDEGAGGGEYSDGGWGDSSYDGSDSYNGGGYGGDSYTGGGFSDPGGWSTDNIDSNVRDAIDNGNWEGLSGGENGGGFSSDGYGGDPYAGGNYNFAEGTYSLDGATLNDVDPGILDAINEGRFSGGEGGYGDLGLGPISSTGMFGMDFGGFSTPTMDSSIIDALGYNPTTTRASFAPTESGISLTNTSLPSMDSYSIPGYDDPYHGAIDVTASIPSITAVQNLFESDVPNIQNSALPEHMSVNFSLNPYDRASLLHPEGRWANAVGLTENIGRLAQGYVEDFQAPVQNVFDRARVNYSGYGTTIEKQARAPSQYSGINVRGHEKPGSVKGMISSNDELARQGYGLAMDVLSGRVPDLTGGAMSFRGHGVQNQITSRDPNTVDYGGNVFGNMNAQERAYAELARDTHPYNAETAVGAYSAPEEVAPGPVASLDPYGFSRAQMGEVPADFGTPSYDFTDVDREYGRKEFSDVPDYRAMDREFGGKAFSPDTDFAAMDREYGNKAFSPEVDYSQYDREFGRKSFADVPDYEAMNREYGRKNFETRPSFETSGYHLGFDSLDPTPDFEAPSMLERMENERRANRELRGTNYATNMALGLANNVDFDALASELNSRYGPARASTAQGYIDASLPYNRSITATLPDLPTTVLDAPPRVALISPEREVQRQAAQAAPARTTQAAAPTAQPAPQTPAVPERSLIGKGISLGTNIGIGMVPIVGQVNTLSGLVGGLFTGDGLFNGPTIGGFLADAYDGRLPKSDVTGALPGYGYGGGEYHSPIYQTNPQPAATDPNSITEQLDSLTQVRPVAFNHAMFYSR